MFCIPFDIELPETDIQDSDKHFSKFYLQDGGKNQLAWDMEQNYVTVTLCIIMFVYRVIRQRLTKQKYYTGFEV